MKNSLLYLTIISLILSSCDNSGKLRKSESKISESNRMNLVIKGDINDKFQVDSIFNEIKAIPLETNDNCLITQIDKVLFFQEKMLVLDHSQRLLTFNLDGKFLYEISKRGRGPGEYSEIRAFDIDKDGNIYTLQFEEILKFDIKGKFLQKYPFQFSPADSIECNPLDFARKSNGNFYLWGGSFGIFSNPDGKLFAMYEMTEDGRIVNKYFPLKHILNGEWSHRFRWYGNILIMNPVFGSNIIYSFDTESVKERYFIDFGKKTYDLNIPDNLTSIRDSRLKADQGYFHSISKFIETDDWIFFMFVYQGYYYNVYFSKKLNRSFLSKQYPPVPGRITPSFIEGSYDNKFVGFTSSKYVLEQIATFTTLDSKVLSSSDKNNLARLKQLQITDNPVVFICSLKKY